MQAKEQQVVRQFRRMKNMPNQFVHEKMPAGIALRHRWSQL
jgi:hypothetical protein